jgi:hypothetical protein
MYVNTSGRTMESAYDSALPGFSRFSKLRYQKDSLAPSWTPSAYGYYNSIPTPKWVFNSDGRQGYQMGQDHATSEMLIQAGKAPTTLALADNSFAVGSISVRHGNEPGGTSGYVPPDGFYGSPFISSIDLPGTTIGNKFKHPVGRNSLFNEIGQIATMQGDVSVLGVYDPPENLAFHTSYQVYLAKSGGTGAPTGTSGTDGNTISPNIFDSTGFDFTGHVGKFIKVTDGKTGANVGIYEITSLSGNNAVTDANTINEAFSTYAGGDIVWELVTGPIAEYFIRKRRYHKRDLWLDQIYSSSETFNVYRYLPHGALASPGSSIPFHTQLPTIKTMHDRGACWWAISLTLGNDAYGELCLRRWIDDSLYPDDYPYFDGDITGGMPAGITNWRHMDIDRNNKIWLTTDDTSSGTGSSVFRIDPYPLDGGEPNSKNPALLNSLTKQASLAAAGLPSLAAMGVVCDNENGHPTHGRTWVVCGDDGAINGGLYYSEDGGATMKGLVHEKGALTGTDSWTVAGDGVTVTNPAVDASLNTELVAGEWITFEDGEKDESKRQVESVDGANQITLTAATAFPGGASGLSMKKGAINSADIGLRFYDATGSWNVAEVAMPPGVDHDSSGRLYWCPFSWTRIVRFDPATTDPVSLLSTSDVAVGIPNAFTGIQHVMVSRMPDPLGFGDSVWHDNVWVGGRSSDDGWSRLYGWETYTNSGVATVSTNEFQDAGRALTSDDVGKYVKIHKSSAGNDGYHKILSVAAGVATLDATLATESNICWELYGVTRYYYAGGPPADNFPTAVYWYPSSNWYTLNCVTIQDRVNGDIFFAPLSINGIYDSATRFARVLTHLDTSDPEFGTLAVEAANVALCTGNRSARWASISWNFDQLGMGTLWGGGYSENWTSTGTQDALHACPHWSCLLWDGSQWAQAPFNGIDADLDFDGSGTGPLGEKTLVLGQGLRRVFSSPQELEHGLYLRFDQAGGATTQPNEYVVDENVTWVCALGRVKDNTMTAEYYAQMFKLPTVTRLDEAAVEVGSPWTTVGGWDGGYVDSASQQAFPWNRRGIAEGGFYWSDGTTTNYESMLHVANNPSDPHYMVSRRIHDEATFPRAAELTLINSSGEGRATSSTYDFTAGDVGKTIRVENATDAANNTSKVITDVLSPGGGAGTSTAVLDSAWAVAPDSGGAVTWRLRDVPEVSYVVSTIIIYDQYVGQATWTLLSSRDAGISWDVVKQGLDLNAVAADSLISVRRETRGAATRPRIRSRSSSWTRTTRRRSALT